jgi:DNA-binding cell septation regulator SpoVG
MNEASILVEVKIIDRGNLKAFADITLKTDLGEVTLRSFRVVQMEGKEPWVGFPTISYVKNGKTINNPVIEASRGINREIANAILEEYMRLRQS